VCYIGGLGRQSFKIVSGGGLEWLECAALARFPWLVHAFSTRRGGVSKEPARGLNLGMTASDSAANVEKNRRQFFTQLGAEDFKLASLRQTHSTHIYQAVRKTREFPAFHLSGCAAAELPKHRVPIGDALITDAPGILLSVRVADCLPILLADPRQHAVAAVHAGWRGTLARIVEKTVGVMRQVFGSDPRDLMAAVGPGIRACCYEVGPEVVEAFCGRFVRGERYFRALPPRDPSEAIASKYPLLFLSKQPPGHLDDRLPGAHLDLVAATNDQLQVAGLRPSNIHVAGSCTACRTDLFFSHRKEGARTGRMMAVVGIRPEPG
jgi:YfiH family protein